MSDPFQVYEIVYGMIARTRANIADVWKVGLVIGVAVTVASRVVFSWLGGAISGAEGFTLLVGLLLAETAAVRWVGDFQGARLALLLMLPIAVWGAVEVLRRVGSREAYRSAIHADMGRFRAALRRDPRNAAARVLLGDAHMKLRQTARALAEYRAALALEPGSHEIRYKLERAARPGRTR